MKTRAVFIFIFLYATYGLSQKTAELRWPLDTPALLTGNYGELRPNHFHAGIDLSTGARTGRKVYAAATGYVSRIRVNSGGYGNCVYITHPGKKVTVYAHLDNFSLKIASAVREEQFRLKSFEVELLPAPGFITVSQGEVIGLSGNSGGSTGPHLHFEVRDEDSETPLNPLEYYTIEDKVPPHLEAIAFYDLSDTLNPAFIRTAKLFPATVSQTYVVQQTELGIAFSGFDLHQSRGNRNNIYRVELFFDGTLIYAHRLRTIDFSDSRYVNEFAETKNGVKLQKCFVPTLFPPRLYDFCINKGRITFSDTLAHALRFVLYDEMGNTFEQQLFVRSEGLQKPQAALPVDPLFVDCTRDFSFENSSFGIYIPAATLYRSTLLRIDERLHTSSSVAILPEINCRSAFILRFRVPAAFARRGDKLVLQSGTKTETGVARNDSVFFYLKSGGVFRLLADTRSPEIKAGKPVQRGGKYTGMSFHISDKLSGISAYNLYVNGKWVIAAYDAKYNRLSYAFDEDTPRGPLNFVVDVTDRVGNTRKLSYRLHR